MSTQSTQKLADTQPSGIEAISSFEELVAVLAKDPMFSRYQVEMPSDQIISLSRDKIVCILLSEKIWGSFERRLPYIESASEPGLSVACVGSDWAEFPVELRRPDIQQVGLPLSKNALLAAVNCLHNYQTLMLHSHAEAKEVAEASENVKYVMSISRELNGERDIPKLLNLILQKARDICHADAGSIYTVEGDTTDYRDGVVRFRIPHNQSVKLDLAEFTMPISEASVVGNAILHGVSINIPDLYHLDENPKKNPYGARHDRTWDERNRYESHSMLTVPMYDISHNVIGVIQLINRKKNRAKKLVTANDFKEQIIPFDDIDQEYAEIVAQQAGIALENANMQANIENLFNGFVNASVTAIEQRDPTTSGHSHRVAHLTLGLARVVTMTPNGKFGSMRFTADQMQEIEYASLLHDFGKLGVRESVLLKAKKLYPWEMDLLLSRFENIESMIEIEYLRKMLHFHMHPDKYPMGATSQNFEIEKAQRMAELQEYLKFVQQANEPTVLESGGFEKLKDIANRSYDSLKGDSRPFLLTDELKALSVSRGSLTREEFAEIQSHVTHTYDFLREIPWGKRLANVPQIAAKHHEKLDGTGYPTSAGAAEIPAQTRMMTIADIFDALTASDRPYKKAVPIDRALDILLLEVKGGKIDPDLYELFLDSKVYEEVLAENFTYKKIRG